MSVFQNEAVPAYTHQQMFNLYFNILCGSEKSLIRLG